MVHARYQQRGGEDESTDLEIAMLRERGHDVHALFFDNRKLKKFSSARIAAQTIWNRAAYREVTRLVRDQRPDIVHLQNTFPAASPAVASAAVRSGVAVVQSLRNFRLLCVNALLFRDGAPCFECVGRHPIPGVVHKCYRQSRPASSVVAAMILTHRALGTWTRGVTRFIATSEYVRRVHVAGGIPEHAISVKPNMLEPDPGLRRGDGDYLLYVGRLSSEKGLGTLLAAWSRVKRSARLLIVGDGPLAATVRAAAAASSSVQWLGALPLAEVVDLMGDARAVVVPSEWGEPFGRVVIESLATGTPVIAARSGGLPEIVLDGANGWLFEPGDITQLTEVLTRALSERSASMRAAARASFEMHYTAERNHEMLLAIYEDAIAQHRETASGGRATP